MLLRFKPEYSRLCRSGKELEMQTITKLHRYGSKLIHELNAEIRQTQEMLAAESWPDVRDGLEARIEQLQDEREKILRIVENL